MRGDEPEEEEERQQVAEEPSRIGDDSYCSRRKQRVCVSLFAGSRSRRGWKPVVKRAYREL